MHKQSDLFLGVSALMLALISLYLLSYFGWSFKLPWLKQTALVRQTFVVATSSMKTIDVANPIKAVWEQVDSKLIKFPGRDSHTTYEFNNRLFLTGGLDASGTGRQDQPIYEQAKYFNDIWVTTDGKNWQLAKDKAAFPPIRSATVVNFKGVLYMLGGWSPEVGYQNGIWQSTDGINWQKIAKASFDVREGQKVVIFKDKLWLIGGVNYSLKKTFNDVWSSNDGVAWKKEVANAPWSSRWDHDVTVFKNHLYLAGGMNFNGVGYGDVWTSTDGVKWQKITDLAPWKKRQGQALIVFKNFMWLIGGIDAKTNEGGGDTWYTDNGIDWQKTAIDGGWSGREDHEVNVFKDKIIITGGMNGDFQWLNDVWIATVPVEKIQVEIASSAQN